MSINRDEWLKALAEAGTPHDDDREALTVDEFAEMFDVTRVTASRRLERLAIAGKATRVRKRTMISNGRTYNLLAYRLVQ